MIFVTIVVFKCVMWICVVDIEKWFVVQAHHDKLQAQCEGKKETKAFSKSSAYPGFDSQDRTIRSLNFSYLMRLV